ncbi:hypothetical protein AB833_02290 [Chromatiales bacterium (ex Bugula neritina AB1)]|nr:hypothetical protein AB833_02290 [Chromatiales bacterium (ex Bugula neritina AB1)]
MLHRVHRSDFSYAQFNPCLGGSTRFAPIQDTSGNCVHSLYAGATLRAAIHETIFHDIPANADRKSVPRQSITDRSHSVLKIERKLKLVELRSVTLSPWGLSRNELISSSPRHYAQTALWAQAIHHCDAAADGLVWTSNQCDPDDAYLFFGDRVSSADFSLVMSRDGATNILFLEDVVHEGWERGVVVTV